MSTPFFRGRRLRRTAAVRSIVSETALRPAQMVAPLFVCEGTGVRTPIPSLPSHRRLSVDQAEIEAQELAALGVGSVLLFGVPATKDATGKSAWNPRGPVPRAITRLKATVPELVIWADVCLCEYTSHGHCGVGRGSEVDNDATLPSLARAACTYAEAGADVVAPSDMMDGRIGVVRAALDRAGFTDTIIVSYAAKYASAFYGPFREAAGSTPTHGDRRGYQMDPANVREAIREVLADIDEGADAVIVKPGLPYLDVIRAVRERVHVPVAAYQVSGEYAMMHAAAERGWLDLGRAMHETATALRRAGADLLITYFARQLASASGRVSATAPLRETAR